MLVSNYSSTDMSVSNSHVRQKMLLIEILLASTLQYVRFDEGRHLFTVIVVNTTNDVAFVVDTLDDGVPK